MKIVTIRYNRNGSTGRLKTCVDAGDGNTVCGIPIIPAPDTPSPSEPITIRSYNGYIDDVSCNACAAPFENGEPIQIKLFNKGEL